MENAQPSPISQYISRFPADVQARMEQIRTIIREVSPDAEERISYQIPAFHVNGSYLIYFAGFKNHIGIYPVPTEVSELKEACSGYKTSGKGTIQFQHNKPLPLDLIRRITRYKLKENKDRAKAKKTK